MNVSGEGGVMGCFTTSTSPFATTAATVAMSLGRSVTARTAIGPTLLLLRLRSLLLLGELGVRRLALDSAQLVSLGVTTLVATGRRSSLLIRERSQPSDDVGLQVLDLIRGRLAENL